MTPLTPHPPRRPLVAVGLLALVGGCAWAVRWLDARACGFANETAGED